MDIESTYSSLYTENPSNRRHLSMQDPPCSYLSHYKSPLPQRHSQHTPLQPTPKANLVRKVQLVYYLCHGSGLLEHPHLLQLSLPPNQPAMYLKDVRKCLSSVRGNYLFSAFAWSYKRSYKNGYVWQDVFNDQDVILPLHPPDHYVLKGSEILSDNSRLKRSSHTESTTMHQQSDTEDILTGKREIHNRYANKCSLTVGRAHIVQRTDVGIQTEEGMSSDLSEEEQESSFTSETETQSSAMELRKKKTPIAASRNRLWKPENLISVSSKSLTSYKIPVAQKKVKGLASITDTIIHAGRFDRTSSFNQKLSSISILASCGRPDLDIKKNMSASVSRIPWDEKGKHASTWDGHQLSCT